MTKKNLYYWVLQQFNLDIVEKTLSKPQETLEFKMNKQKESFFVWYSIWIAWKMDDGSHKFKII